jgi:hypothetical protein
MTMTVILVEIFWTATITRWSVNVFQCWLWWQVRLQKSQVELHLTLHLDSKGVKLDIIDECISVFCFAHFFDHVCMPRHNRGCGITPLHSFVLIACAFNNSNEIHSPKGPPHQMPTWNSQFSFVPQHHTNVFSASAFSGLEHWNEVLEWRTGMEYWTGVLESMMSDGLWTILLKCCLVRGV